MVAELLRSTLRLRVTSLAALHRLPMAPAHSRRAVHQEREGDDFGSFVTFVTFVTFVAPQSHRARVMCASWPAGEAMAARP